MTDLEGIANRLLGKGAGRIKVKSRLVHELLTFKDLGEERAGILVDAMLDGIENAKKLPDDPLLQEILKIPLSGATMHDLGVGCRGEGDFFVHRLIAKTIGDESLMNPMHQDDAGAVKHEDKIVVASVDGTHSRLSDFPFIAGFHVARAALRDIMVKGAEPVALIDDMHLGDDGDVGKLFDFIAGVSAVAELSGIPLIAGSTLRIGGDMVIGDRLVSGVGAIGVAKNLLARANVQEGDIILMTKGAGGGTIATTALYSGNPEVVKETLNIDFIRSCKALADKGLFEKIHAMLDVTNGGLRGDADEVCKTAGVGMRIYEDKTHPLVNEVVLELLEKRGVDYLGVSLDSLMVFVREEDAQEVIDAVRGEGIEIAKVGEVIVGDRAVLIKDGEEKELTPGYRESAYTPIKKAIGEMAPEGKEKLMEMAHKAQISAMEKKRKVIEHVKSK